MVVCRVEVNKLGKCITDFVVFILFSPITVTNN